MIDKLLNSRFNWLGFGFIVFLILVWQVFAISANSIFFPKSSDVWFYIVGDWQNLLSATLATLRRAALGFLIALVTMLPLGILLGRIRILGYLFEPVIELLRPIPPIALVPLAMMLLGIGDAAKLVIVLSGASFPILLNAIEAVKVQDPMQVRLARSLGLTTLERMVLIDFPTALPQIFAGIRLSITVALLLTVVSEMIISTDGLGNYLRDAQSNFSMQGILASIVVIAIVAVIVNGMTNWVSRRLLDWHFRRAGLAGM